MQKKTDKSGIKLNYKRMYFEKRVKRASGRHGSLCVKVVLLESERTPAAVGQHLWRQL